MDSNEILREIADELHNLNLNVMELTKVLKDKQTPSPVQTDDAYDEAMRIHKEQLAKSASETIDEDESKYRRQQEGLDRQLRNLGVM